MEIIHERTRVYALHVILVKDRMFISYDQVNIIGIGFDDWTIKLDDL